MVQVLKDLDEFVDEPTKELNGVITDGETTCENVSNGLDDVELRALQIGFGVPFTIVSFLMLLLMGATAMGFNNNAKNCWTSWFITPLFIFLVMFLIILTMAFSIGGIVNADFCSGGSSQTPDETLINIMDTKGTSPETLEYRVVTHLVNVSLLL